MIDALIAGRLYGKPAERTAKNGSRFATGKVRVATDNGEALFVAVITFRSHAVTALLALDDGDSVALAGELTPTAWVAKDGTARAGIDLLAHAVLTEYHVTRKRKAVRDTDAAASAANPQSGDLLDDPLPDFTRAHG